MIVKNITGVQWTTIFMLIDVILEAPINYDVEDVANDFRLYNASRVVYDPFDNLSVDTLQGFVNYSLPKHKPYLDALLQSIQTEFDPLQLVNIQTKYDNTDKHSGGVTTTLGTKVETTNTGSDTFVNGRIDTTATAAFDDAQTLTDTTRISAGGDDVTNYNTTNTTNTTGSDSTSDTTQIVNHSTEVRTGHDTIDYVTALKALYETKMTNWYYELYRALADNILLPSYSEDYGEYIE